VWPFRALPLTFPASSLSSLKGLSADRRAELEAAPLVTAQVPDPHFFAPSLIEVS
jgi:hypothetical protein